MKIDWSKTFDRIGKVIKPAGRKIKAGCVWSWRTFKKAVTASGRGLKKFGLWVWPILTRAATRLKPRMRPVKGSTKVLFAVGIATFFVMMLSGRSSINTATLSSFILGLISTLVILGMIIAIVHTAVKKLWTPFWVLCTILVAGLLVWWLRGVSIHMPSFAWSPSLEAPSLATIGMFFRQYWLWILLAGAALYIVIGAIPSATVADRAQTLLIIVVTVLLAAAVWAWIDEPSPRSQIAAVQAAPRSVPCVDPPTDWSVVDKTWKLTIPAGSRSPTIPVGYEQHIEVTGYNYTLHTVFGQGCSGPKVTGGYIENKDPGKEIYVSYAIRRD